MAGLARPCDPALIVGTETGDDAGVYRLDDERAIVVTADFITPVADDPYMFGQVAAANALSDVFAMGGRPLVAVALCAFPKALDPGVAREILDGGQAKVIEAGAQIAGGHTVRNEELLYGLSVTGIVHPDRVLRNVGARVGDVLVLTKPLGTGLVINGRRKGLTRDADLAAALASMAQLNREAGAAASDLGAHAATDITGFGLLGHALKMARGSGVTLRFDASALPLLDGAVDLARAGVTTGSTRPNRAAASSHLLHDPRRDGQHDPAIPPVLDQLLYDPQTSGGLLVALPASSVEAFLSRVRAAGAERAARIGEVVAQAGAPLEVVGAIGA